MKIRVEIQEDSDFYEKDSDLIEATGWVYLPKRLLKKFFPGEGPKVCGTWVCPQWGHYTSQAKMHWSDTYGLADNYLWAANKIIYDLTNELLELGEVLRKRKGIELKFEGIKYEIEIKLVENKKGEEHENKNCDQ